MGRLLPLVTGRNRPEAHFCYTSYGSSLFLREPSIKLVSNVCPVPGPTPNQECNLDFGSPRTT
ncbi:hypothetical protein D9M69_412120 [compost metagenome]